VLTERESTLRSEADLIPKGERSPIITDIPAPEIPKMEVPEDRDPSEESRSFAITVSISIPDSGVPIINHHQVKVTDPCVSLNDAREHLIAQVSESIAKALAEQRPSYIALTPFTVLERRGTATMLYGLRAEVELPQ
jgi:hypothetical protein